MLFISRQALRAVRLDLRAASRPARGQGQHVIAAIAQFTVRANHIVLPQVEQHAQDKGLEHGLGILGPWHRKTTGW